MSESNEPAHFRRAKGSYDVDMRRANIIHGRIEEHAQGLGTATEEMVRERAAEIAITNGRRPEQLTQADIDQARLELENAQNAPPPDAEEEEEALVPREGPMGVSSGHAARTKLATDEQALPEDLVAEGVEEATHERMVEGNKESRRRDERFEDQLPSSEA